MIAPECPNCGERVAIFARSCARCGTPNRARGAGFAVLAALLFLLAATGVATYAVVSWHRLPVEDGEPDPTATSEPDPTATSGNFGWLAAAMQDCDTTASGEPRALHFLVIPLAAAAPDDRQWRNKSLDNVGNAILLPSDDALAALTSGALRISTAQYVLRVRDDETRTIYKWSPSVGVKRFSAPDADRIEGFKVQFLTDDKMSDDEWGVSFGRRKGTCYWVNAVIGPAR
jgi:hypothetical protein